MQESLWVPNLSSKSDTKLKLFCFPFSGGDTHTYAMWDDALPADIEVRPIQMPARGMRLDEPPIRDMKELVPQVCDALMPMVNQPFALFGHSLGGLVAFEVARELTKRGVQTCQHLIVSSYSAPHLPRKFTSTAELTNEQFLEEMYRRYLYKVPDLVASEPELLEMLLVFLRADIGISEVYKFEEREPLPMPLTAVGGTEDQAVPEASLRQWAIHTKNRFHTQMFPGGHFYLFDKNSREALLNLVKSTLTT